MNKIASLTSAILLTLSVSACATTGTNNTASVDACGGYKKWVGALGGAGTGAMIGNQFGKGSGKTAMTIVGGVLGAGGGYYVGNQLDEADCQKAKQAQQEAAFMNAGGQTSWLNDNTGARGQAMVNRAGTDRTTGQRCKEMVEVWQAPNGQQSENVTTVCQNRDGSWSAR